MKATTLKLLGLFVVVLLLGGLFLAVFLTVRERQEISTVIQPPASEVRLYHYFSDALTGSLDNLVSLANSRDSEYRLVSYALDHEAFKSMILTTLAKTDPPELFSYWAGARVQKLVDSADLEPIDDLWAQFELDKLFPHAISVAASTYSEKKYLLPITQHLVVFFYNKKIFESNRLQPPTDWAEFATLCQQLQQLGTIPITLGALDRWPAQFWFDYLLLRTAGPEYRAQLMRGEAAYTDAEVVRVYQMWSELIQLGYFNADANRLDWAQATELVRQGSAAMTLMGTWAMPLLAKNPQASEQSSALEFNAGEDFDYFLFPVIDQDAPIVALGPIDGLVLSKNSVNKEAAKAVLAFFAEAQVQQIMSEGSGSLAPSQQVPGSFYAPFKRRIKVDIERAAQWAFNYDLATPPEIAELGMDSFSELIEFPQQYEAILNNVGTEAKKIFNRRAKPATDAQKAHE